jgi:hypothetical protein
MVGCTPNSRVSRLRLMVVGLQERQVADKSPETVPLISLEFMRQTSPRCPHGH